MEPSPIFPRYISPTTSHSSRYWKTFIPSVLRYAPTALTRRVNVLGAVDRLNGMTWNSKISLPCRRQTRETFCPWDLQRRENMRPVDPRKRPKGPVPRYWAGTCLGRALEARRRDGERRLRREWSRGRGLGSRRRAKQVPYAKRGGLEGWLASERVWYADHRLLHGLQLH